MESFSTEESERRRIVLQPLILAMPHTRYGGCRRSLEVLLRAKKHGMDPIIVVPTKWKELIIPTKWIELLREKYRVYVVDENKLLKAFSKHYVVKTYIELLKNTFPFNNLLQERPDIIVSHSELPWFVLKAFFLSKQAKVPWTALLQAYNNIIPTYDSSYAFFLHKMLAVKVLRKTKALCVSSAIIYEMERYGFPLRDVQILNPPLGINHEVVTSTSPSQEEFDAVYFASLLPEKGIYDVLRVWALIVRENPKAKLCFMGFFDFEKHKRKFYSLVKELNLQHNIIYKGFVEEPAKYSLIKSSKVFIYPSKLDSVSLVVIESLACGVPVVAYDIPALRYHNTPAVRRIRVNDVVSMAESAKEIISNFPHRSLSKAAIDYASSFTWDKAVEAEKKEYISILNE